MSRHQKIHTGEKLQKCSKCGEAFVQKDGWTNHLESHGLSVNRCSECGKDFGHRDMLIEHQRNHSKKKRFECTLCAKGFSWRERWVRHKQSHAGQVETCQFTEYISLCPFLLTPAIFILSYDLTSSRVPLFSHAFLIHTQCSVTHILTVNLSDALHLSLLNSFLLTPHSTFYL